jgi:hypothetical protein
VHESACTSHATNRPIAQIAITIIKKYSFHEIASQENSLVLYISQAIDLSLNIENIRYDGQSFNV